MPKVTGRLTRPPRGSGGPDGLRQGATLEVGPEDFPFLDRIRGLSDDRIAETAAALATGAPLPE